MARIDLTVDEMTIEFEKDNEEIVDVTADVTRDVDSWDVSFHEGQGLSEKEEIRARKQFIRERTAAIKIHNDEMYVDQHCPF